MNGGIVSGARGIGTPLIIAYFLPPNWFYVLPPNTLVLPPNIYALPPNAYVGVKTVQEEKFVEISRNSFFPLNSQ